MTVTERKRLDTKPPMDPRKHEDREDGYLLLITKFEKELKNLAHRVDILERHRDHDERDD